jgi:23S rRNA (cytidine1920-2'-O)/16S rRNA (cytidine1409-2'-O)-methyltransferase
MSGRVRRGTEILDKPGKAYPKTIELSIVDPPRYVSRGGEKLENFLTSMDLPIFGADTLDVGASTGGFTDCLLQRGASSATCVDVGRSQLHPKLLDNPRITNREKLNARYLKSSDLPKSTYSLITVDVSFISLKLVLLPLWPLLTDNGTLISLIKPQFEATKEEADKGRGVIRDPSIHHRVTEGIRRFAWKHLPNSREVRFSQSSLPGSDGNIEFFLALQKKRKN